MAGRTRKSGSKKVLKVDSPSKIPQLEKILKQGKVTIVLVFADWCGHCHKFQKDIWEPICKKDAMHNRVAVRDDMINKTSLANSNFKYLPSVLVVNEKGKAEEFQTPDGEATNAMPTPKTQEEMERVVNVPLTPTFNNSSNTSPVTNTNTIPRLSPVDTPVSLEPMQTNSTFGTPEGTSFKPTPLNVQQQKGGAFYQTLQEISQGILPVAVLGGLSYALRGGAKRRRTLKKSKRRMIRA